MDHLQEDDTGGDLDRLAGATERAAVHTGNVLRHVGEGQHMCDENCAGTLSE